MQIEEKYQEIKNSHLRVKQCFEITTYSFQFNFSTCICNKGQKNYEIGFHFQGRHQKTFVHYTQSVKMQRYGEWAAEGRV